MMHHLSRGIAAIALGTAALCAQAAVYTLDDFQVVRNGALIFDDSFDDGLAPPQGTVFLGTTTPGYPANRVVGDFTGAESGGRLQLDPSRRGLATVNPITGLPDGLLFQAAYLNVNTQSTPDTAARGLKLNHSFTVSGLFDLVTPGPTSTLDAYGIRLADFDNTGTTGWNDVIDLEVFRSAQTGLPRLFFIDRDLRAGTRTVLGSVLLDPAAGDQILLAFTKPTVDDPTIVASWQYVAQGVAVGAPVLFAATARAFDGEVFTRPGFFAIASVPEPAGAGLMLAGLAVLAWRRRSARAAHAA